MAKHFKLMGFYFWLLALFTVGRWVISFTSSDYARATWIFSLVPLALIASAHHAAFARAFQGYSLKDAAALGALIGGAYKPQPGERLGVLVCGANVNLTKLVEITA